MVMWKLLNFKIVIFLSEITVQRSLSAGNIVIKLALRGAFRAQTSSFVKFELVILEP